ncbi:MAG: hypothetical protein PHR10_06530 [Sphaerochaetaceae bacterium]|nr:hypothetical protein [Sphaerochaetaceae bacterium]
MCCSVLGPIIGSPANGPFKSAWIDDYVGHIVVFVDTLEFHRKTDKVVMISWKSTAKRDAWAYRRKLAHQKAQENDTSEVTS